MPSKPRRPPAATDRRFRRPAGMVPDHGTAERWQHSGRILEPTGSNGLLAARATEEHVIDRLMMQNRWPARAGAAAMRFKQDYQLAGLAARLSGRYSPASSARDFFSGVHERSDFEEAAYRRWRNAVREMGKLLSDVVITTVCHDMYPAPAELPRLRQGLKKLADWYGMPEESSAATPSSQNVEQTSAR
jgi:hypothetical protein